MNPAVLEWINSLGAISLSRVDSSSPINKRTVVADDVVPPPPLETGVDNILKRYKHLWAQDKEFICIGYLFNGGIKSATDLN